MAATAQTSAGVRDITKRAIDVIRGDSLFKTWRTDQLTELAQHGPFLQALGRALVEKVDWEEVAAKRNKKSPRRKGGGQ